MHLYSQFDHMMSEMNPIVWRPEHGGSEADHTLYPGFPVQNDMRRLMLSPGEMLMVNLQPGDLLSFVAGNNHRSVTLGALNDENNNALQDIGIDSNTIKAGSVALKQQNFDQRELVARLGARNFDISSLNLCDVLLDTAEPLVLKAGSSIECIIAAAESGDDLVSGETAGNVLVTIKYASATPGITPALLGQPKEEFIVTRGTAQSYQVAKGELVQVIDLEGKQCSDFMAMYAIALENGLERYIDSTVTRSLVGGAWPVPGLFDKFFDQDMVPLIAVEQDTVGRHDTFALACTARGYENRGFPGHVNCSDNISEAYDKWGINPRRAWPAINFFFNSWILPSDNRIQSDEAWSRAGDYVAMRALQDLVCVSTACPDDVDPINGWNPTDVMVRIYPGETPVRKSVAWRSQPDSTPVMTTESPFHCRTSLLTNQFVIARDLWSPRVFDSSGAVAEYWACRDKATVQDMSGLRKLDIAGPDAEKLLQRALTRDVRKLSVNRGFYSLMCDQRGAIIDDGTLFRLAPDVFRWCCGLDDSAMQLRQIAQQEKLSAWITDLSRSLCNLAIQGPASGDVLAPIIFTQGQQPDFNRLKWFGFTVGRLHDRAGHALMVTRSGFTGEKGYEIFCENAAAEAVWDAVQESGKRFGVVAMGGEALNTLRLEAGLMMAGAEFGDTHTPYECGLGFAVDLHKHDFIGRDAVERDFTTPRKKLVGLKFETSEPANHGDKVFIGRREIGTVTSSVRSPQSGTAIAMARLAIEETAIGHQVEVGKLDGYMKRIPGTVCELPFEDPERKKPRA